MRNRSYAVLLITAVLFSFCIAAKPLKGENSSEITCRVESPVDGSYWIGTAGDGLFRLGRNGRCVRYTADGGQISSNYVKVLLFDINKVLWILDDSGILKTYSSLKGFQSMADLPEGIVAIAAVNNNPGTFIFATAEHLYSLNSESGIYDEIAELPVNTQFLESSQNGDFLWLFGQDGVAKYSLDGSIISWEEAPSVPNLLPFVFDTNDSPAPVEKGFSVPIWALILVAFIFFILGLLFHLKGKSGQSSSAQEILVEEEVADKIEPYNKEEIVELPSTEEVETITAPSTSSDTLDIEKEAPIKKTVSIKSGEFTKKVISIINDNLSDPGFDVESIASITGLSRIHVNRKLKAEGSASPSSLIKDARMAMALKMLRQGKATISQISSSCGFRTPSYFATAFKEYYGKTPTEFLEVI